MERIKDFINYHRYEIRRAAQELIEDNPDEVMDPSDDLIREYCFVNPITLDLYIGGRLYSHQWLLD
jgi:hypothetical protein